MYLVSSGEQTADFPFQQQQRCLENNKPPPYPARIYKPDLFLFLKTQL